MNSLGALNWGFVQSELALRARSPLGVAAAERHLPFASAAESRRLRVRVAEAVGLLERSPVHGYLSGTADPSGLFERVARDAVLAPAELWACGHFLSTVALTGLELRGRAAESPSWAEDFARAPKEPALCARIRGSVSSEGAILDGASAELARLRRGRTERRAEFESALEGRIKDWHSRGLLQDKFYDVIDGRYVVPVKTELQSKLEGSLVGRSNTGQSVFIEPGELVAPSNALKEIELAIRAEEFRILRSLSSEVAALAGEFLPWVEPLAELDLACAAACLARDFGLKEPAVPEAGQAQEMRLREVFHPELRAAELQGGVVRNSFVLAPGGRGMLISGPNTGGKTVLLKASALAASMARAGLFVAAEAGSVIPHYADVLAFIGDEQDLAQGLSSFSAQILDLKAVLASTRGPQLIVVDEMLSSTDPEEASALAQAILEELVENGHHVMVTSHFAELSLRCRADPRIAVAAMEFDEGRPTYRLRPDELGSSHALDVAERLGLPRRVLDRARGLVSPGKLDYQRAQAELKQKEDELEAEQRRVRASLERAKEILRAEFAAKLEAFMDQARSWFDEASKALTRKRPLALRDAQAKVEKEATRVVAALEEKPQAIEKAIPIAAGATVKVRSMKGARGTVLELLDDGRARVAVGNFKMDRPLDDLEAVAAPARPKGFTRFDTPDERVPSKLDLRGKRFDEALAEAERYVDQAFRGGAAAVTVVTGHGTGALKKGLKELLSGLSYVKQFGPERPGDDGATLIEFER